MSEKIDALGGLIFTRRADGRWAYGEVNGRVKIVKVVMLSDVLDRLLDAERTLRFYGDSYNYCLHTEMIGDNPGMQFVPIEDDGGEQARAYFGDGDEETET